MCTIGNSFYNLNGVNVQSVFKQCDLVDNITFLKPVVKIATVGSETIQYVAFTRLRGEETPAWSGVNEYGVCFVAADSYLDEEKIEKKKALNIQNTTKASVFDMYLNIITKFKTAKDAVAMAKKFYETEQYGEELTDILMIADEAEMYFIETVNGEVRIVKRTDGHFASTNHCRMFYEAVPYEKNHSTYLRLKRAEEMLQSCSDDTGIGNLLRDSYYGKTVWSVCRYASVTEFDDANTDNSDENLFYTQAAVIFSIKRNSVSGGKPEVICEYVINGNAADSDEKYVWSPFDSGRAEPQKVSVIGKNENIY